MSQNPVSTMFDLTGKLAIVTGNGSELTPSISAALSEAGAMVVIASHIETEIRKATVAVEETGGTPLAINVDLSNSSEVEDMLCTVLSQAGKVDILVNNLGIDFYKPFVDVTLYELNTVIDRTLRSTFLCSQSIGTQMLEQNFGRIINIGSGLMDRGLPNGVVTSSIYGYIRQMTASLGLEWATKGIRVNAIATGWMLPNSEEIQDDRTNIPSKYVPLKRYGEFSEIAGLLVYLASDNSDFVTGQVFHLDGGLIAHA